MLGVLERGATVIFLLGGPPPEWLPGARWEARFRSEQGNWMPTWFLHPGDGLGLRAADPEHPFLRRVPVENATWHHHGVLWPPEGAEPVIVTRDGASVIYIDRVSTPGTLLVATLDPIYHFGSYFMPACERFLDGFLPWVVEELLEDPARVRLSGVRLQRLQPPVGRELRERRRIGCLRRSRLEVLGVHRLAAAPAGRAPRAAGS